MHRCTLIRSAHHSVNNAHAAAVYCGLTGHDRGEHRRRRAGPTTTPPSARWSGMPGRRARAVVAATCSLPYITKEGAGGPPQPGFFGGWLGKPHDPLFVLRDPNAADFAHAGTDARRRTSTAPRFDAPTAARARAARRRRPARPRARTTWTASSAQAFDLLTSPATREAFRIDREPAKVRDAYGRNIYGQSVLLARRLIEAGTRVACISWAPDANATWDTHGNNFKKLKGELLPQLDAAVRRACSTTWPTAGCSSGRWWW